MTRPPNQWSARGAASSDLKLWLAGGFAVVGIGAAVWSAIPQQRPERDSARRALVETSTPTDERGNAIEGNYRRARSDSERSAVLNELSEATNSLAASLPASVMAGAPDGLGDSARAVLSMMMDPSEEAIEAMFESMGGTVAPAQDGEEGNAGRYSTLVRFIQSQFDRGELDLDRLVVRPKPDQDGPSIDAGPRRVPRDAETRQRRLEEASGDSEPENRRVSAFRITGPYEGIDAVAQEQRPIEVRVPYRPRAQDVERILAMDLLYNPATRTWQMVEMRFEHLLQENGG
ncbi:MAG: hypothetical protein ACF8Q5_13515 [Phycisphaerales bacterium JB040]